MIGEPADRLLTVLRRVADVAQARPHDLREANFQRVDDLARVVDAQRRLRDVGDLARVLDAQAVDVLDRGDEMDAAVDTAARALDFGMTLMTDQDDLAARAVVLLRLLVDLRDERARRVDHGQRAPRCLVGDLLRDPVRAEHGDRAVGDLVELVDEARALGAQVLDHVLVVHDFVAHVDGRAVEFKRAFDDGNRALDPGAKAARLGKQDLHASGCLVPLFGPPVRFGTMPFGSRPATV